MGLISKSLPFLPVLIPFPRMRRPSCEELRFLQKCLAYLNDVCVMNGSNGEAGIQTQSVFPEALCTTGEAILPPSAGPATSSSSLL